jgi:RimJ/RimL family protein N-acetyltransferase
MQASLSTSVQLRPETSADQDFLFRLYSSTREEEMRWTGWSATEQHAFLAMQFRAQTAHYRAHYEGAAYQIIEVDGQPAGRLYLYETRREIRIMDISLLPQWRGRGAGTELLNAVLIDAQRRSLTVSIHVECFNPARRLYERLGFRPVEDKGVYLLLEWQPELQQHEK